MSRVRIPGLTNRPRSESAAGRTRRPERGAGFFHLRIRSSSGGLREDGGTPLPCSRRQGNRKDRFRQHGEELMNIKGLGIGLAIAILGVAHADHPVDRDGAAKLKPHSGELVRIVRETTRRYQDVNQATADGYQLLFGCVSGPDDGAMGMHYVNL